MNNNVDLVAARVRAGLHLAWCRPARVLAEREQRSLVVVLDTDSGPVVAKATGDGGAARSARALAALARIPASDLLPLRVPRLLLHDPGARLVVVEHVMGATVADHLVAGDLNPLELAGTGLARLHAAPVVVGPRRELTGHVADLIHPHPHTLAAAVPELAPQLTWVLNGLRASIGAGHAHPVHRDLHPRQLLVQGETVVLLDWDLAAQGDPALDAGNLRAWLEYRRPALAPAAIGAFEHGYTRVGDPAVLRRAATYAAFTRLRLAVKSYRLDGRAALPTVRRLLDEAAALLTEEPARAFV